MRWIDRPEADWPPPQLAAQMWRQLCCAIRTGAGCRMRGSGSLACKTAARVLLLSCCQIVVAANFQQANPEAARALKSGNLEAVRQFLADPRQLESIESNIYVLQDVYGMAVESGSVPLLRYLDSRG